MGAAAKDGRRRVGAGGRRRVQHRMMVSITDSKDMNLSRLQETVQDRGAW